MSPFVQVVRGAGSRLARLPRRRAPLQSHAERVVRLAQLGIDLEGLLERIDGAREITSFTQCLPELVLESGVARIGSRDTAEMFQGACEVAFLAQSHPQVHVSGDAVRLERERLLEHVDGFGEIPALGQRGTEVRVGPPILRIQLHSLSER